ncbi:MAG: aryl-sulfate sulfotransferase [Deltaproteobacteria bacterium]|nr:aryl-sulfate sulfotransferase [Deltaproteobacteria bacterium]
MSVKRWFFILTIAMSVLPVLASSESWGQEFGLIKRDARAFEGYTLFAPMSSEITYLIDMDGRIVNTWESKYQPGQDVDLLENGHLLRTGAVGYENRVFSGGGMGGRVQEYSWDGRLIWDYSCSTDKYVSHHDIDGMPNGNVLIIAWGLKTEEDATAAGRNQELHGNSIMYDDYIMEVKPTGRKTGEIVWEWHVWDHLIQDYDPSKRNYGDVASHPELVNINFGTSRRGGAYNPDWTHINSVDYNRELDQIVLSARWLNEVWIIDHSTTTREAAGHSGGKSGKGGDILYRWGNPQIYRTGAAADQQLFSQHDAQWISPGLPGEGNISIFSNGDRLRSYSSVDEITPPVDVRGRYSFKSGRPFGPSKPVWTYSASTEKDFTSRAMAGAQRLPNGNTLISSSNLGTIFEVTSEKEIVWEYLNPVGMRQGSGGSFFKAYRFGKDYPGFVDRDLTPKETIPVIQSQGGKGGKGGKGKKGGKKGKGGKG